MNEADQVKCTDQCGASIVDAKTAESSGWQLLQITGRWRCGPCFRALRAVAGIIGPDGPSVDPLPPDSRGALPKETASTISPPVLKG